MHQLSIFNNPEPTPAPAKVLKFPQPQPTKESGLEGHPNIATQPLEPAQTEASRVTEIAKNKSPLVPAKPIVISYELSEPIAIGDTVLLRDGTTGTCKKYAYNDKELPAGVKPCQHEGLREIVVTTAAGEFDFYAYQLTKLKSPKTDDSTTPTVSGDELSQEPAQEQETECTLNPEPSEANAPTLKEGDVVLWVKNFIRVRVEWIAINNTIAAVRDVSSKQAYNVPPSELQAENLSHSSDGIFMDNHKNSKANEAERPSDCDVPTNEVPSQTVKRVEPKPPILPAGKLLTPISKEESNSTGKILTFTITTKRSAEMGVPDPLLTGKKTCTRRLVTGWTASTVAWYQRAFDEGLNIQAWTAIPLAEGSRKLADIRLTQAIYQEALRDMPDEDLEAEGGLWNSKDEFIETVCKGKPEPSLKVWVVRFELVSICI